MVSAMCKKKNFDLIKYITSNSWKSIEHFKAAMFKDPAIKEFEMSEKYHICCINNCVFGIKEKKTRNRGKIVSKIVLYK